MGKDLVKKEQNNEIVQFQSGQSILKKELESMFCKDASEIGKELFFATIKATGLNPVLNQICLLTYKNKKEGTVRSNVFIQKNGYLAAAENHPDYDGHDQGTIKNDKCEIIGGWAKVFRKSQSHPVCREAYLNEFTPPDWQLTPSNPWVKMPRVMILKVALSHALREAFPTLFSGTYDDSERAVIEAGYIDNNSSDTQLLPSKTNTNKAPESQPQATSKEVVDSGAVSLTNNKNNQKQPEKQPKPQPTKSKSPADIGSFLNLNYLQFQAKLESNSDKSLLNATKLSCKYLGVDYDQFTKDLLQQTEPFNRDQLIKAMNSLYNQNKKMAEELDKKMEQKAAEIGKPEEIVLTDVETNMKARIEFLWKQLYPSLKTAKLKQLLMDDIEYTFNVKSPDQVDKKLFEKMIIYLERRIENISVGLDLLDNGEAIIDKSGTDNNTSDDDSYMEMTAKTAGKLF